MRLRGFDPWHQGYTVKGARKIRPVFRGQER